ncbi:MAG TPA: MBL fold metallo-hydrolase [Deltaproteobacteria bacterium]|nr:MBL fold metallo-hydrolase [Deltaproteobacteria bacterium]HIJ76765.1 MBL fold metallo-hydrolase [Deltaproteobacteria bacterium]
MILEHLIVGMLQTNCYLLGDEESRKAVVIDPGAEGKRICSRLVELGLKLSAILVTHAHFDHTMAAWTLKKWCGGEIYLNSADKRSLIEVIFGLAARFFPEIHPISPDEVDRTLAHGDQLQFGAIHIEVLSTPGHTPGHVSFYLKDQGKVFSGDLIFAGSIGRTDFAGGSFQQLMDSVRSTLFRLPNETIIYPGHGPASTVGREKMHNPFFSRESG